MRAYLGIGGNLGDVGAAFDRAIVALAEREVRVLRSARRYRTRPIGPPGQPDYLNTVLEIETALEPIALLAALQAIEREIGRTPSERWGPRIIDLDLLLYGDRQIELPELVVPHRELSRRRFVLAPLAELAPDQPVPGSGRTVEELLLRLEDDPRSVEPT